MPLTCSCSDDYDWFYNAPEFYQLFDMKRRKKCCSCGDLIDIGSYCGKFDSYEFDEYGDEKDVAPHWMCETCTDIFFILEELGYCIVLVSDNMKDLLGEYRDQKKFEIEEKERKMTVEKIQNRETKRFLRRDYSDGQPYKES